MLGMINTIEKTENKAEEGESQVLAQEGGGFQF